ncbi:MAG: radical SAM/SPASM domain-containing protein [Phycisphaerales bacterium]
MSEQAMKVAGLIVLAREDAAAAMRVIGGGRVIEHVIGRMRKVKGVEEVVVVTDREGDAADVALDAANATDAALSAAADAGVRVVRTERAMMLGAGRAARAWSGTTWRGGIGGATVYDEVIDAKALAEVLREPAFEKRGLRSALIVGATWPLLDSGLCGRLIERHWENVAEFKLVFTQSPPGLAGVVVTRELLEQMAADGSSIGHLLDYNPTHPQGDPIARDICVQIGPELRQAKVRAIAGARRWETLMQQAFEQGVGDNAEKAAIGMVKRLEERGHEWPVMVTVELTTKRNTGGPLRVAADRPDMTMERAQRLFEELTKIDDVAVMFGGAGDPLCHPRWAEILRRARDAGIKAVAVDTDLNVEEGVVDEWLAADLLPGVVKVRINADSKEMYERMMGVDAFARVGANVQRLLRYRLEHAPGSERRPWVVPTMVKTKENVTELESFVDRWSYFAGAVLVEGPPPPEALAEGVGDLAVIDMAPPRRFACRQLTGRLTVLSDGRIARCDQDVRGACAMSGSVTEGWKRIGVLRAAQREGRYTEICGTCRQWHRP